MPGLPLLGRRNAQEVDKLERKRFVLTALSLGWRTAPYTDSFSPSTLGISFVNGFVQLVRLR